MPITDFPPIEDADENGLLAIGGDYSIDSLLLAYTRGIFPWPIDENYPIAWFSPDPRGIIATTDIHIPRKIKKFIRNTDYKISFNQNFAEVIRTCAQVHQDSESGTWITEELIEGYISLHKAGFAYSVEITHQNVIIGGLYGVTIGHYISGESMFHKEDNASKIALLAVLYILKSNKIDILDTQMVTPITSSFGARELERNLFLKKSKENFSKQKLIFPEFLSLKKLEEISN